MKTIITCSFLVLIAFTTSAVATDSQNPTITLTKQTNTFKFFRVHRQASGVALSWATSSANAASFVVERSDDFGDTFQPVDNIPCGGTGTHKYVDNHGYAGTFFYRIRQINSDNSEEESSVETVRIVSRR